LDISAAVVKALRDRTGAGLMDCKKALQQAEGDIDGASQILKQRGLAKAEKKATRIVTEGLIEAYVHTGGRIGAMVELNCETDFVARTEEFRELAHNLAMQVAATAPSFVALEDVAEEAVVDPAEACLLLQPFIKDPSRTIQELIAETVAKVGENIKGRRFARFELGSYE